MKTVSAKSVIILALLLVLLTVLFPGCIGDGAPSPPIKAQLSFSELPLLNKTVQLTATFRLQEWEEHDARDVTARIILSEGFEKIDGELEWKGDFIRGNTYTLVATVKAVKTGDWTIEARASYSPGEGSYLGGYTALYVSVSEENTTVSETPGRKTPIPVRTSPPTP